MQIQKRTKNNEMTTTHYPPCVRPRLRVTRFAGGCSAFAIVGDPLVSDRCALRFSVACAIEGVAEPLGVGAAAGVDADAGVDVDAWMG